MRPQLLMQAVGIFIIGTLLMCITSGRWLMNGDTNIINALASFHYTTIQSFTTVSAIDKFFNALVTALGWWYPGTWLDYTRNGWVIFILIPCWLTSVGVIWAIIEVCIQVLQGLISAARSLLSLGG